MHSLRIEVTRGSLVESVHRVTAVVTDADGRLVAGSGDPDLVTFWRSAAKPFQALPLILDGAQERFGLTDEELAEVYPFEDWILAVSHVGDVPSGLEGDVEDDLFAGVPLGAHA